MRNLRNRYQWGLVAIVLAAALLTFSSPNEATTTVLYIQLGDTFTGNIGEAGVDTVEARFNAVQGTVVNVSVRALQGRRRLRVTRAVDTSPLQPSIVLKDASGTSIDLGSALSVSGALKQTKVTNFKIPASGNYILEIGGVAGSGNFAARTQGRLPNKVNTATLSGTVTNSLTSGGIPNVSVSVGPYMLVTDADGAYTEILPAGDYRVVFDAANFEPETKMITLLPGVPSVLNVALNPVAPVMVSAKVSGVAVPGSMLTATVEVLVLDGSVVESISWVQLAGPAAEINGSEMAMVSLATESAYKDELIHVLTEPPVGADQLPPNVPPPPGEFPGGLQNRFEVVGVNPFALEEAALVALKAEVVTTSGTYHDEVEVHTALPWKPSAGLRDVPIGVPVLLHGKDQASYDWSFAPPDTSAAALVDPNSQNPHFTPDVVGVYEVAVTEEAVGPVTLAIYAGTWRGVIVGQNAEGRPVSDSDCTGCHGGFVFDAFTPWEQTGHAEIFTNNLDTSTHYGPGCFSCHTVGYDPDAANGGSDDAPDYQAFLGAGLLNNPGDNWTTMLDEFPATAQLANIQCENCHGPQSDDPGSDSSAHGGNFGSMPEGAPRMSLSSDVCATCHGEPLRHARFQQWQLSGHANYELAIDEGDSGNCSRCHTGNGFLTWLPILLDDDPTTDPTASISVSWTADEVHPQTCQVCHDPHSIGTTTGVDTNATVRISGNTPPLIAGFTAYGVGRGAVCMTCHNSRRGLRNDANFDSFYKTSEAARAPHGSAQTDVLMGQNAYLLDVGTRGNHSFVTDTCVNCHMEQTPPPDILSYNQGGTNHTFFAGVDICAGCHGVAFDAEGVQSGVQGSLDDLQGLIEAALLDLIAEQIALGRTIDLPGEAVIVDAADIKEIVFGETRGRQAMAVTFMDGTSVGLTRMTDVDVLDALSAVLGDLYFFAEPALIKAGWNWNLINNDGSLGIHNPSFASEALQNAIIALDAAS